MTRVEARQTIEQMVIENRIVEIESDILPDKPAGYLKHDEGSFYYIFRNGGSNEKLKLEEVIEIFKKICFYEKKGCNKCDLAYLGQCIY